MGHSHVFALEVEATLKSLDFVSIPFSHSGSVPRFQEITCVCYSEPELTPQSQWFSILPFSILSCDPWSEKKESDMNGDKDGLCSLSIQSMTTIVMYSVRYVHIHALSCYNPLIYSPSYTWTCSSVEYVTHTAPASKTPQKAQLLPFQVNQTPSWIVSYTGILSTARSYLHRDNKFAIKTMSSRKTRTYALDN